MKKKGLCTFFALTLSLSLCRIVLAIVHRVDIRDFECVTIEFFYFVTNSFLQSFLNLAFFALFLHIFFSYSLRVLFLLLKQAKRVTRYELGILSFQK
jgi:hypothetical protein